VLIVDYLQLLRGSSRAENRVNEVSEITQGLKAIAKELNIPVVALSQLSRQVENREDKRPQLSDLRESGSIEQDADVVMFVFREEYYREREKPGDHDLEAMAKWQEVMEQVHGKAEVIIGKQRHGPIGTVELSFEGRFTRFGNLVKPWQQGGAIFEALPGPSLRHPARHRHEPAGDGARRLGRAARRSLEQPVLVMSHLACADEPDHPMNAAQLAPSAPDRRARRAALAGGHRGHPAGADYHFDLTRPASAFMAGALREARPVVRICRCR
jgi:hypothetical protein